MAAALSADQKHAFAVAAATAEAATATAHAVAHIIRLTSPPSVSFKQRYAAIVIQTAFRSYLAKRALRALKGVVKLQALVRGQNVRKRAKMTLKCMQPLLRVQSRLHARHSHDEGRRRSTTWKSSSNSFAEYEKESSEERSNRVDPWSSSSSRGRASFARRELSTKTLVIDTSRPCFFYSSPSIPKSQASPRCLKEEKSYSTASTPNLRCSTPRSIRGVCRYSNTTTTSAMPNYMAFTESAKARVGSQSTPNIDELRRGDSAKKRLSYEIPKPRICDGNIRGYGCSYNSTSPSFRGVQARRVGMGQQSNYNSYGELISPCSTTDLTWLR